MNVNIDKLIREGKTKEEIEAMLLSLLSEKSAAIEAQTTRKEEIRRMIATMQEMIAESNLADSISVVEKKRGRAGASWRAKLQEGKTYELQGKQFTYAGGKFQYEGKAYTGAGLVKATGLTPADGKISIPRWIASKAQEVQA